jgi:hypothetical protein
LPDCEVVSANLNHGFAVANESYDVEILLVSHGKNKNDMMVIIENNVATFTKE